MAAMANPYTAERVRMVEKDEMKGMMAVTRPQTNIQTA